MAEFDGEDVASQQFKNALEALSAFKFENFFSNFPSNLDNLGRDKSRAQVPLKSYF